MWTADRFWKWIRRIWMWPKWNRQWKSTESKEAIVYEMLDFVFDTISSRWVKFCLKLPISPKILSRKSLRREPDENICPRISSSKLNNKIKVQLSSVYLLCLTKLIYSKTVSTIQYRSSSRRIRISRSRSHRQQLKQSRQPQWEQLSQQKSRFRTQLNWQELQQKTIGKTISF